MILCIETSGKRCSVALGAQGKAVWHTFTDDDAFAHAERLHVMLEDARNQSEKLGQKIAAIAVSAGPGSYTGLRIGVSAAKGLCLGWNVPLIAVSTLEVIAAAAKDYQRHTHYIAMVDARRMDAFVQVFSADCRALTSVEFVTIEEGIDLLQWNDALFAGEGSERVLQAMPSAHTFAVRADAAVMCATAQQQFEAHQFADVAYFEPDYYKEFVPGKPKSQV